MPDYNNNYPEDLQKEIFEKMLKRRKTRDRPKGLTNPVMRNNFGIIKEKWQLWGYLFRVGLHFRDWDSMPNIKEAEDYFFGQCQMYLIAHGIIQIMDINKKGNSDG